MKSKSENRLDRGSIMDEDTAFQFQMKVEIKDSLRDEDPEKIKRSITMQRRL